LAAQSAPSVDASAVTFDVASIKPNASGAQMGFVYVNSAGVFNGTNVTTRGLILNAYDLRSMQVDGGPMWIGTDRFDVIAKPPGFAPRQTGGLSGPMQLMLRSLLVERFKSASHMEMKALPVFLLTKARSDGTLGPWIRPTTADCATTVFVARPPPQPRPPLPREGDLPTCRAMLGPGRYVAGNLPIARIVGILEGEAGRMVLDRTGLGGNFDFDLEFAPNQMAGGSATSDAADSGRPSIFIALQEQLGLKLESATMPVAVLVVDHIERPTAN
jgi:uncharacterized protein (TIGR03435 family)